MVVAQADNEAGPPDHVEDMEPGPSGDILDKLDNISEMRGLGEDISSSAQNISSDDVSESFQVDNSTEGNISVDVTDVNSSELSFNVSNDVNESAIVQVEKELLLNHTDADEELEDVVLTIDDENYEFNESDDEQVTFEIDHFSDRETSFYVSSDDGSDDPEAVLYFKNLKEYMVIKPQKRGLTWHTKDVESIGCTLNDQRLAPDNPVEKCRVKTISEPGNINFYEVDVDRVITTEMITQVPESIVSYSSPNYPPSTEDIQDFVAIKVNERNNECVVGKDENDSTFLYCGEEDLVLETVDGGFTDEIYEDASKMNIGNYA